MNITPKINYTFIPNTFKKLHIVHKIAYVMAGPKQTNPNTKQTAHPYPEMNAGERHASWLELFFDLVFVLAVAQVAQVLAGHSDLSGFLKYAALFLPVWWSWVGYTFYADRFESEEVPYRILMFAGMLAVVGFSLTVKDAFGTAGDPAFVLCYVLIRLFLVLLYLRVAYYIPLNTGVQPSVSILVGNRFGVVYNLTFHQLPGSLPTCGPPR